MKANRPGINLALGGGGAKGIAHIGVLKAIEDERLQIESIVGTSIGAIWGALLAVTAAVTFRGRADAQQQAVATVEQIAYQLRFSDYLDLYLGSLFARGLVKGNKFEAWLETMLFNTQVSPSLPLCFRDLEFDLTITATDAATGDSIICNKEHTPDLSIAKAVRASMSIQGFFKEVYLDVPQADGTVMSVRCWDGGTTGNCRFDLARRRDPERPVIASSLTYRGEPMELDRGLLSVFRRRTRIRDHSISILMRQIESLLLENIDKQRILLIRPPLGGISTWDLNMSNQRKALAIASAHQHALERISDFRKRIGLV